MIPEIGDKLTFTPAAYFNGDNGTDESRKRQKDSVVHGVVTSINHKHRWYRVTWKPDRYPEQHECFKF